MSIVAQLCLTLCDPMDCSPPGSSVHEIFQARILEWVVIPFSRGSSRPRDQTWIACIDKWSLYCWAIMEAPFKYYLPTILLALYPQKNRILLNSWWSQLEEVYRGRGWASPSRLCPQISDSCHHSLGSDSSRRMFHSKGCLKCSSWDSIKRKSCLAGFPRWCWPCISPGLMVRGWCCKWAFHGTAYASSIYMAPVLYQPPLPRAAFSAVALEASPCVFGLPYPYYSNSLLLLFLAVLLPLVRYSAAKLQHLESEAFPIFCPSAVITYVTCGNM